MKSGSPAAAKRAADKEETSQMQTITQGWKHYIEQWQIPEKCDVYRTRLIARTTIAFFGPRIGIESIQRADLYRYIDFRKAAGKSGGTIRKEMIMYYAMCSFNARDDKIEKYAKVKPPKGGDPRQRSFTLEEVGRVWAAEMSRRIRLFFLLDFGTAARSRAIEEVRVGQVDWARRVIDYRQPGVNHKNKRRGEVALADTIFAELQRLVFEIGPRHPDEYLIGDGNRHKKRKHTKGPTSTYAGCCAVLTKCGLKERWIARHVGRKTWATLAAEAGVSHLQISATTHDTIKTLQQFYIFPNVDKAHPIMNRVNVLPALPAPAPA